jgi:hypothetical protein
LTENDLNELIDREGGQACHSSARAYALSVPDAPERDLARIKTALELHKRYIHYQFAFDSKSHMEQDDFIPGLLYAMIALEAAHAVLLQLCLRRKLTTQFSDETARDNYVKEKAEKLLIDLGLKETVELTSRILLDPPDQPSPESIRECQAAISIRNDIMHALVGKRQYKLRDKTDMDLMRAHRAVMQIYEHFVRLIEREEAPEILREPPNPNLPASPRHCRLILTTLAQQVTFTS